MATHFSTLDWKIPWTEEPGGLQSMGSESVGPNCCCCSAKSLQLCLRWQPTRLPRPWDSPGKNTGVGCHFLLQCMTVKRDSEVAQSCPTPRDPMDCSPPGSSIHGVFQARVLERGSGTKSQCLFYLIYKDTLCLLRTYTALNKHKLSLTLSHTHI